MSPFRFVWRTFKWLLGGLALDRGDLRPAALRRQCDICHEPRMRLIAIFIRSTRIAPTRRAGPSSRSFKTTSSWRFAQTGHGGGSSDAPSRHILSRRTARPVVATPLKFHLAFLEFKEDGSPQPLRRRARTKSTALSQYALLQEHLKRARAAIQFRRRLHPWLAPRCAARQRQRRRPSALRGACRALLVGPLRNRRPFLRHGSHRHLCRLARRARRRGQNQRTCSDTALADSWPAPPCGSPCLIASRSAKRSDRLR